MIAALIWKEWREQRTFALAVLAFGFLAMVGVAILVDNTGGGRGLAQLGPRELMPLAVAYLAGTVCGAMLLADEKEVGTLEFLDSLPSKRRQLWQAKILFGMLFAIGQCLIIGIMGVALGCYDSSKPPLEWIVGAMAIGCLAFAWGVFGGATTNSTLGAVFLGSLSCFLCGGVLAVPIVLYFGPNAANFGASALAMYVMFLAWIGCGLLGSVYFFTQLDRDRTKRLRRRTPNAKPSRLRSAGSFRALVWLAWRQAKLLMLIVFGTAALFAGVMLAPEAQPLLMWPGVTLMFGVLAGVTVFTEEQGKGIARFWSERRLPVGRLWLVKTALHFGIAIAGSALIFGVVLASEPRLPLRSRVFVELRGELLRFLFLGVTYGFVCAHLTSLLFRKTIVAGLVAIIFAVTMAGALLPSLFNGGALRWQLWLPAAVLLITARLLLYPWAHGRILTKTPLLRAGGGLVTAFAVLCGGLAYRVLQIPDTPDRLAEARFEENLPSYDANEAGNLSRSAASQFNKSMDDARDKLPPDNPLQPQNYLRSIERLRLMGWSDETANLKPWLDRIFADPWLSYLDEAASKSMTGIFDDPRDVDVSTMLETTNHFRDMIIVLRARGLQRQEEGAPEEFVRFVRGGLTAIRAARNKCGTRTVVTARESEFVLLRGVEEWLTKLDGRPDLAQAMVQELLRHDREMPTGGDDLFWAEQVIMRNTHTRIASWLPKVLRRNRDQLSGSDPGDTEADIIGTCWSFPWERLRRERLQRALTQSERVVETAWLSPWHRAYDFTTTNYRGERREGDVRQIIATFDQIDSTQRRMRIVQTALVAYRAEVGSYPPTLETLVPKYLPRVPRDPFGAGPIGYRITQGERFELQDNPSNLTQRLEGQVCELLIPLAFPLGGLRDVHVLTYMPAYFFTDDMPTPMVGPGAVPPPPIPAFALPRTRQTIYVKPGHPVLWSVGRDKDDDGGRKAARDASWATRPGEDWLFFVP